MKKLKILLFIVPLLTGCTSLTNSLYCPILDEGTPIVTVNNDDSKEEPVESSKEDDTDKLVEEESEVVEEEPPVVDEPEVVVEEPIVEDPVDEEQRARAFRKDKKDHAPERLYRLQAHGRSLHRCIGCFGHAAFRC